MSFFSKLRDLFNSFKAGAASRSNPTVQPIAPVVVPVVPTVQVTPPVAPSAPVLTSQPVPTVDTTPKTGAIGEPPHPAKPGNHWELVGVGQFAGWQEVFTDPRIYNADGSLKPVEQQIKQYYIAGTVYTIGKEFGAYDGQPDVQDLIAAWNEAGANHGGQYAWRLAEADFNGKFKNGASRVRNMLLKQYPDQTAEINWSDQSAEAENPRCDPFNG